MTFYTIRSNMTQQDIPHSQVTAVKHCT